MNIEEMIKRRKLKKEKIKIINQLERLDRILIAKEYFDISFDIDSIIMKLDDELFELTEAQIEYVKKCLEVMEAHSKTIFEMLLIKKCEHISMLIDDSKRANEAEYSLIEIDDQLYSMLDELNHLNKELEKINQQMMMALGKDKDLWKLLNTQKRIISNRIQILNKNYMALLNSKGNATLVEDMKRTKVGMEKVQNQNEQVDIYDLSDVTAFASTVEKEILETSDRASRALSSIQDENDLDLAYELELAKQGKSPVDKEETSAEIDQEEV